MHIEATPAAPLCLTPNSTLNACMLPGIWVSLHSTRQALHGHARFSQATCCMCVLQSGLDKLAEAAGTVDELSRQAEAQRSLLAIKQEEADTALTHIQVWTCRTVMLW